MIAPVFKDWLEEAISTSQSKRVGELIGSYLHRKTGKTFAKMPGVEEWTNSHGHGWGIRFFYDGDKCIRFNWSTSGVDSSHLTSVDLWDGSGHDAKISMHFERAASLVATLPFVCDFMLSPSELGKFFAIPADSLNESIETLSESYHDEFDEVILHFSGSGKNASSLSSREVKVRNELRREYASFFSGGGRGSAVEFTGGTAGIKMMVANKHKILSQIGGVKVTVTEGGKNETYHAPKEIADMDANIDRLAYEDQLTDMKALIKLVIKGASNACFIAGRGGIGKALPTDTLVLTPTGWVEIGSIRVGDFVLDEAGRPVAVVGVYPQGVRDVCEIKFSDGRTRVCDEDHLWEVNHYSWDAPKVLSAKDIRQTIEDGTLDSRMAVPLFTPQVSTDVVLPISPYVLGAFLGDGTFTQNDVRFSCKEDFILEKFVGLLPKDVVSVPPKKGYDWRFKSQVPRSQNTLVAILTQLGLKGKKSDKKFIPEIFKNASLSQKIELLQGLLDTDGFAGKGNTLSFSTVSKQLAQDFAEVVWSIGGKAKITLHSNRTYVYKGARKPCLDSYDVHIQFHNSKSLVSLPRKVERLNDSGQYSHVQLPIVSVSDVIGEEECVCVKVDSERGLFVTADYVVTHNTHTVEETLNELGLHDGTGYFKNTGSSSAAGLYGLMFKYKDQVLLFDDSDGSLADQDSRNLFKSATDTKKERKLVWNKVSSRLKDPDDITEDDLANGVLPTNFVFTGKVIFISNLPINKLDPDGALRTRALMISIDPTDEEVFNFMDKICVKVPLEEGLHLSAQERREVVAELRKSKQPGSVNIRKLVRGLNIRAGEPNGNWQRLVTLYA